MSDTFHPDDSRLTAYVLGELEAADRAAVEAQLKADPDCRRIVDELQQTTGALFEALQAEPVPALSESQRKAIRSAAQRPARPSVTIVEPETPRRRRGILPLMIATLACAALVVGVSVFDFDRPAERMAAQFDADAGNLLAWNDGRPLSNESAPDDLRQLSRFDDKLAESGSVAEFETTMSLILEDDAQEIPADELSAGQAARLSRGLPVEQRTRLEKQLPGLATTTTRPQAPGNMGDVTDFSKKNLRQYSAGDPSAAGGMGRTPGAGAPDGLNQSGRAARGTSSLGVAQQSGQAGGDPRDKPSQPARSYGQLSEKAEQQDAYKGGYPAAGPAPAQSRPATRMDGAAQPDSSTVYPTGDLVQSPGGTQGEGAPDQPPTVGYRIDLPAEYGAVPEVRAVELQESLSSGERRARFVEQKKNRLAADQNGDGVVDQNYFLFDPKFSPGLYDVTQDQNGDGVVVEYVDPQTFARNLDIPFRQGSFELGVPDQDADDVLRLSFPAQISVAHQFVPNFAVTDLRRLSENANTIRGLAAGAEVAPYAATNSMTPAQDMLLGAGLAAKEPYPGEEQPLEEAETIVRGDSAAVTWDAGQWFFFDTSGRKLAIDVPGTEAYAPIVENAFLSPTEQPLSTFGLDVDTASYANVRRFLMEQKRFPPPDAVRIEELVNYFTYTDTPPTGDEPLAVSLESNACPWNTENHLVRIGLQAKEIDLADRPPTTLVFLVDTSGSMRGEKKLPLVKDSLRILAREMTENDRIAIVTYNNDAGLLLDSTSGEQTEDILAAIDGLQANGSTNGEAGLKMAYKIAGEHFIDYGQNRVILCTDGDFNVGTSETDPLVGMISEKRASGVFLSICGYGSGNIKDEKLERIADKGNGQYHYVDNIKEARKVFLDELSGTLYTVAKDVKLQVEFNPATVASYRLIGYENRTLTAEDFNNDRVDSGDMGAGHSVTALYEVVPAGPGEKKTEGDQAPERPKVDPLKYQGLAATQRGAPGDETSETAELLTVKLRYKQPDGKTSVKREFPLVVEPGVGTPPSIDLEWSAAVASFGMLLRSSQHAGESSLENVLELAQGAKGRDTSGRRREFIDMVLQTRSLVRSLRGTPTPQPRELSSTEARKKARVGGKYQNLLDKFESRDDAQRYGAFHDYGWSDVTSYVGHQGLPSGYWVYVYPDWYIWGETVSAQQ